MLLFLKKHILNSCNISETGKFLFLLFIVLLPSFTDQSKIIFYLFLLYVIFFSIKNLDAYKGVPKLIKIYFVLILLDFAWSVVTFYINGAPDRGGGFLFSRHVFLLSIIPIYVFLITHSLRKDLFWYAVFISIVLAVYVGYQDLNVGSGRAKGGMHPILFASIISCMSFYMLFSVFDRSFILWRRAASFLAFLLGFTLVVWAQSRGVWAAVPLVLLTVLVVFFQPGVARRGAYGLGFTLLAVLIFALNSGLIVSQYHKSVDNINKYLSATSINDPDKLSSIGTRLEMWKAAWLIFKDNPYAGVGVGGYQDYARQHAKQYRINPNAYTFYHPHNQYLSSLVNKGAVGGVFLFAILLLPIVYLYHIGGGLDGQTEKMSLLSISLAYIVFSCSDVPLEGKATIIFYAAFVSYFLSKMHMISESNGL